MKRIGIFATLLWLMITPTLAQAPSLLPVIIGPLCSWCLPGAPAADFDLIHGRYWLNGPIGISSITVTRNSAGSTDLLPSSASGASYQTFAANTPRLTGGVGIQVEEARTNQLLNSTAPVTQTTASLSAATYTLWVNGAGSATMSIGSGIGCGTGVATNGTPVTFTITIAGTCTVTVAGALNAFQLEAGLFGSSLIVTAGTTVARAADVDTLTMTFGAAFTFFVQGTSNIALNTTNNPRFMRLSDGSGNNFADLQLDRTTGKAADQLNVGGVNKYNSSLSNTNVIGTSVKVAQTLVDGTQISTVNGATVTTHAITPIFVPTTINIGAGGSSSQLFGPVGRFTIWPLASKSSLQIQSFTQ